MENLRARVDDFLAQRRFAVAGVSRQSGEAANAVFRKLRDAGYEVYPVNPAAREVEGVVCYPDLDAVPATLDGVVIATHPTIALEVVRQCVRLGIPRVWMHRSFGQGSVAVDAVSECEQHGIQVIAGGCPLMFCQPVDIGHRCMRWVLRWTGGLPA